MSKKKFKIDANNIERKNYLVNNSEINYSSSELLSELFTKHEVPQEYKKLFFYKNLLNDSIKESFTGTLFTLKKSEKGMIKAIRSMRDNSEKLGFHIYLINSSEVNCSKNDMMDFYFSLYENGFIKNYLETLNDYFLLGMNVDYIFELSKSNESLSTKKRLYKQNAKNNY